MGVLRQYNGNLKDAAKALGIDRNTLRHTRDVLAASLKTADPAPARDPLKHPTAKSSTESEATPQSASDDVLREAVDIVAAESGNVAAASRKHDIPYSTLSNRLMRASLRGLDPANPPHGFEVARISETTNKDGDVVSRSVKSRPERGEQYAVPDGHTVKAKSTLVDADGRVVQQWIKTRSDGIPLEVVLDAIREALSDLPPVPMIAAPATVADNMLGVVGIPDAHLGQYSWRKETGESYDLAIARERLVTLAGGVSEMADPCHTVVALFLGDLTHADDHASQTPRSGHPLDVDSRHAKVLIETVYACVDVVRILARRHRHVVARVLPGNHDPETAIAIATALYMGFRDDPRISIDLDPSLFWFMEWSVNLIGATHGHTVKLAQLPLVMAAQMPEAWGRTQFRYFFTGHGHRFLGLEEGGVRCVQLGPVTAPDQFAASGGRASMRGLHMNLFDKTAGPLGAAMRMIAPATLENRT